MINIKKCKKICADPDLFIDDELKNKSIVFINDCLLRQKCKCKWSKKELDNWGITI